MRWWQVYNPLPSRGSSTYKKALDHIRAMEIECEIRDAAGDLVHPTSGATMLNYQPVDSAGNVLTGYSRNAAIRHQTRQAAEKRKEREEIFNQRWNELLVPRVGPARFLNPEDPPTVADVIRVTYADYTRMSAELYALQRERLINRDNPA